MSRYCIFLAILFALGGEGFDPEASITGLYTGPYFDPLAPRNFTAHLGDQAILPCTVRQLGDKSVSWVRMRDADILTVDRYTFVGDERFESQYSVPLETWNLIIKYVQERDAGLYECQVSTEPKMSQLFSLRVVIPKVSILPPGDRYVKAGSQVRIDCQITDVVQLPDYIFWYHEDKRVMDHRDPNLVVTVKNTGTEAITSTLIIHKVPPQGSGNYTCMPSNLHSASVILHVLNEKHPAAMQGERTNSSCKTEAKAYILALLLLFVMLSASSYLNFNEGYNESTSMRRKPLTETTNEITLFAGFKKRELLPSAFCIPQAGKLCTPEEGATNVFDALKNLENPAAGHSQKDDQPLIVSLVGGYPRQSQIRDDYPQIISWSFLKPFLRPQSKALEIIVEERPLTTVREPRDDPQEVSQHLVLISRSHPMEINPGSADREPQVKEAVRVVPKGRLEEIKEEVEEDLEDGVEEAEEEREDETEENLQHLKGRREEQDNGNEENGVRRKHNEEEEEQKGRIPEEKEGDGNKEKRQMRDQEYSVGQQRVLCVPTNGCHLRQTPTFIAIR